MPRNPVKIHFLSISVCRLYSPVAVHAQHLLLPFYHPVTFKLLVVAEKCWINFKGILVFIVTIIIHFHVPFNYFNIILEHSINRIILSK